MEEKNRYGKGGVMRSLKFRAWDENIKELVSFIAIGLLFGIALAIGLWDK